MGDRKSDCKKERGVAWHGEGGHCSPDTKISDLKLQKKRSISTPSYLKQTLYKRSADQYL